LRAVGTAPAGGSLVAIHQFLVLFAG